MKCYTTVKIAKATGNDTDESGKTHTEEKKASYRTVTI